MFSKFSYNCDKDIMKLQKCGSSFKKPLGRARPIHLKMIRIIE